ncbi:MAG: cytochrome P450 [Mycobacterium sp.]|uniref:cytochrome P450 n=1 Tax=Mycobacterium sp. TaxID=1785 RepID=UPI003F9A1B39
MTSPPLHHKESPVFAADRGAYWRQLRALGPVVKIEAGKPMLHGYYITKRDDVRAALLDPDTFVSPPKTFKIALFGLPLPQVPLSCGTRSEHSRFGRVLHPLFSPKALAPFAPALHAQAATLFDTVAAKGQCDAVEITDTYACQALLTVCGIPPEDPRAERLIRAAVIGDPNGAAELELIQWLDSVLVTQTKNPERLPGVLWPMLEGIDGGSDFPLSQIEAVSVILLLFSVAGVEMVSAANCFMLLRLARDPQLQTQLREDPAQIPAFVEEMIRLEAPGPAIPRVSSKEVEIGGVAIPAGSVVWLALEAAGRENGGDEILTASNGEIQRQRHWAFGSGMHRCLGMHLARLEMVAFLTEWLSRVPPFELQPGFTPTVVHQPTGVTHLASLLLRWGVR